MKINPCKCKGHYGASLSGGKKIGWLVYCTDCGSEPNKYTTSKNKAVDEWNEVNKMSSKRYHAYPGRWQSPHLGHRYIIDQHLAKGEPVLILIRPMPIDENNPFTAQEVEQMLRAAFFNECMRGEVAIQILSVDIASINTGRGVGFDVISHTEGTPDHIKRISATQIRKQIRNKERGWRDSVMPGVEKYLEAKFGGN